MQDWTRPPVHGTAAPGDAKGGSEREYPCFPGMVPKPNIEDSHRSKYSTTVLAFGYIRFEPQYSPEILANMVGPQRLIVRVLPPETHFEHVIVHNFDQRCVLSTFCRPNFAKPVCTGHGNTTGPLTRSACSTASGRSVASPT